MTSSRLLRLLAGCAAVLLLGHVAGLVVREVWGVDPELGMVRQFDLNAEGNLAAWFSSFVLTICAGLALLVTVVLRLRGRRMAGRWGAMAAVFLLMAVDETSQLHDMATGPLRNGLGLDFGALYFAWLIPALLLLAAGAVYFTPLFASLSHAVLPRFVFAIVVYLTGAVVFEMIGGSVVEDGRAALSYLAVMTMEESLEITGGLLLVNALLTLLRELRPTLTLTWGGGEPEVTLAGAPLAGPVAERTTLAPTDD
ncbi:hypothetical protein [Nocardioides sp. SYSU DS0651]|uniref:hypothetical protein n=1 Tax=Nocardioides sp. SYSU DS0651 TaxID=3415955 RepID=UPI003F4B6467